MNLSAAVPRNVEEPPPSKPAYFWWLLANALALCFAIVSWAVCLHIFGNPELPRNYEILGKVGRLPVLKRFTVLDAPNGNAFMPKELYRSYFGHSDEQRANLNKLRVRNYLGNFDRPLLLTYVEGTYEIRDVRKLTPGDFIQKGIVLRAQAIVKPDDFTKPMPYPVFIEVILPMEDSSRISSFKPGDQISLKKSPQCLAVLHVDKITSDDDPALLLTVTPIVYGTYQLGQAAPLELEPPAILNPAGGLPVIKEPLPVSEKP